MSRCARIIVLSLLVAACPRAPAAQGLGAASQLPDIEYLYEGITIRGNAKTRDRFFENLLDLDPGERVRVDRLDRFRRQLLSTGFFSEVETRLLEGSRPETVQVEVTVQERNSLLIEDIYFGISADTPIWGGIALAESNLLGTGLRLSGGFVASGDQAAVAVGLGDPFGALGAPLIWEVEGLYLSADWIGPTVDELGVPATASFEYDRLGGRVGLGSRLWSMLSVRLGYRIERIEFGYTSPNEPRPPIGLTMGESLLSNLELSFDLDSRDHRQMPTRGHRAAIVLDGGAPWLGSDYHYLRLSGEAQSNVWLGGGHVLRLELESGALWANDDQAPYFDGFYVGDISDFAAGRDLDLQFTDRRSLDLLDNGADLVTYGDLFALFRAEWAYAIHPVYGETTRLEVFASMGVFGIRQGPWATGRPRSAVTDDTDEDLTGLHFDLTGNIGLRAQTSLGTFGVSIGSILSLTPLN